MDSLDNSKIKKFSLDDAKNANKFKKLREYVQKSFIIIILVTIFQSNIFAEFVFWKIEIIVKKKCSRG